MNIFGRKNKIKNAPGVPRFFMVKSWGYKVQAILTNDSDESWVLYQLQGVDNGKKIWNWKLVGPTRIWSLPTSSFIPTRLLTAKVRTLSPSTGGAHIAPLSQKDRLAFVPFNKSVTNVGEFLNNPDIFIKNIYFPLTLIFW